MSKTYWNKQKKQNKLSKTEYKNYSQYLAEIHKMCQICGTSQSQDLHHLKFGSYGADKDDRTLIAVCRECHEWCHSHKAQSQETYKHISENNWSRYCEQKKNVEIYS